jgi:hypothetical protein
MSRFNKAFDAGRVAVKNRRTALLLCVLALMAVVATVQEYSEHSYLSAALAPVFFLLVVPWLGWKWIKPKA